MPLLITLFLLLAPLAAGHADVSELAKQADALHDRGMYAEAAKLLLDTASSTSSGKDLAELYWRAARETLELGDLAEKAKRPQAELLAIFTQGQEYAGKAMTADPQNDLGYYWNASNIGRWGQVRGVLNSLFKAQPMRELLLKALAVNPERSDAYYVLGQLYRELPGVISFGNVDAAVSFGRKAVDLREAQSNSGVERDLVFNFITELAKSLYKRNWSASQRTADQKTKATKLASARTLEAKASFYESGVTLKGMSDREEAKALVQSVIARIESRAVRTATNDKDYQKATDVLKDW